MIEYDPCSEAVFDDPYPFYAQLRAEAPIFRHPRYRPWFLSRFDDVLAALLDVKSFTVTEGTTSMELLFHPDPDGGEETYFDRSDLPMEIGAVATLDPPVHTRVRAALSPPFKPAAAERLEPFAREIVRGCIARARERGGLDAVADFAGHLSVRVACRVLGVPIDDADFYVRCINTLFERDAGTPGVTPRGRDASMELHVYLIQRIQEWRAKGTRLGGLADAILYGDFEGRRLNDLEASFHLSMVLIGGTETLPKAASAAIYRLWQHPEQRARVAADPSLAPQAFHEALRYDMPTQMLGRVATREVEFHGQTVEPGEAVMFLWASANRDERAFDRADAFDVGRGLPRILSFGQGTHMCLGMHIARMEGRVLLEELLAAFPEYDVVEADAVRLRSEFFRGFGALPLRVA
ncbi:MAG: cytochrome P450 [Myxococcota bacterium]